MFRDQRRSGALEATIYRMIGAAALHAGRDQADGDYLATISAGAKPAAAAK